MFEGRASDLACGVQQQLVLDQGDGWLGSWGAGDGGRVRSHVVGIELCRWIWQVACG